MIQYSKQIFCVWGGNQSSLSATFDLQKPKETGAVPPLQMHEGNLSRFTLLCSIHHPELHCSL